jgi:diguanylate cyclase (GGDEF)-like protein
MNLDSRLRIPTATVDIDDLIPLRLFAGAELEPIAELLHDCPLLTLRKDEVLLVPGMVNQTLYLLLRGRLRVHLESPASEVVQFIEAGETVGEISAIDEKPTSAHVIADATTTVIAIDQSTFWSLVNTSHAVARNMLLMVVERMRANNVKVAEGMRLRDNFRSRHHVDELTGLRTARALTDLLRRQMLRSSMGRKPLAVLMIEIDQFAEFAHNFGAAAGDQAVCEVAQTLQDQLRPTDITARLDGEKFAVILPDADANGACIVAERLRDAVAETVIVLSDQSILPPVTVSMGIAQMQSFEQAEQLLESAEFALMRAKHHGRNTFSN